METCNLRRSISSALTNKGFSPSDFPNAGSFSKITEIAKSAIEGFYKGNPSDGKDNYTTFIGDLNEITKGLNDIESAANNITDLADYDYHQGAVKLIKSFKMYNVGKKIQEIITALEKEKAKEADAAFRYSNLEKEFPSLHLREARLKQTKEDLDAEKLRKNVTNVLLHREGVLEEVINEILYMPSAHPLSERISSLDTYLKRELNNNGINLTYHFYVTNSDGDTTPRLSYRASHPPGLSLIISNPKFGTW